MVKCCPARSKLRADSWVRAKAWVSRVLKWRTQREAGFTEQQKPPSPDSGGITGRCNHSPVCPVYLDRHHFYNPKFSSQGCCYKTMGTRGVIGDKWSITTIL
ncbi:hypothetical protein LR48_Vigan03g091700 [Vigna angularis]|uniref:Uncharacterized protein n=1 Tax=Phaseolus angularis TaxID=3914 RepID=A0A0L9U427_PHAAN|nr:hypothetical protein LR48_Vigan03g091700 [Vigna angularis]